jgi:transcriptional regulator with XRE-family HTH domain
LIENTVLVAIQSKGARAILGWSRRDLADAAKVAVGTIVDFERGARQPYNRTLVDIRRALEDAGVIFIDAEEGVGGPGVRLRENT